MKFKRGMTLVEVVVASALATVAVGGIVAVMVQSSTLGQTVDLAYASSSLAKNRIERIREIRKDKGYATLAEAIETDTAVDRNGNPDLNGEFLRTTAIDTAYATNLTKITVKVKCKRKGALIPLESELITLISPYL